MSDEKTSVLQSVRSVADALTKTLGPKGPAHAGPPEPTSNARKLQSMAQSAVETLLRSGTPDFDDGRTTEERLIDALDAAALRFIAALEDDTKTEEGAFAISFDQRLDVFKTAMNWVATRRRTKIEDASASQSGVNSMQQRLEQGRAAAPEPEPIKRGPGRPSKAELAARAEREAAERERQDAASRNDDSAMTRRLAQLKGAN